MYQIPDRRAPEVVPEHRPDLRAPAGPLPRAAEILDPLPPVPPPEVREEMRDDPPELPLERPHLLDLGRDERLEVGRQVDQPAFLVLRLARVEANGAALQVDCRSARDNTSLCVRQPRA